jgi:hypothetical protein
MLKRRLRPIVSITLSTQGLVALRTYAMKERLSLGQAVEKLLGVTPHASGRGMKRRRVNGKWAKEAING